MCAWRYSSGANNTPGGAPSTAVFGAAAAGQSPFGTGAGGGVFGASGFGAAGVGRGGLRLATAPGFSTTAGAAASTLAAVGQRNAAMYENGDEEYQEEEEEDEDVQGEHDSVGKHRGNPSAGAPPAAPAASAAAATLRRPTPAAAAAAHAPRNAQLAEVLSRQLFKAQVKAPAATAVDEDEIDEEGFDALSLTDQEFVCNTRDLFDDVDPELLAEGFVPHEHVVGIIADDASGNEATPSQIEDNLSDYKSLQEEIDATLGDYIENHHGEFNDAIRDFSEMVLAVSGSDDTLAQFKKELVNAVGSLESHAEELKALRLRAARALFMTEALSHIRDVAAAEAEVKALVQGCHYLKAVQMLQCQAKLLASDELRSVRAVQILLDTHNATVASLHLSIIDSLLSCIFREERLLVADAQLLQDMLDSSEQILKDPNTSAPDMQHAVHKYWKIAGVVDGNGDEDGSVTGMKETAAHQRPTSGASDTKHLGDNNNNEVSGQGVEDEAAPSKERTLAAIIETLNDDPNDTQVASNYLRFVPLCVKSILLLGKMDHCHETFFSKATRNIEKFIAHFLLLYDAWQRRSRSGATLSGSDEDAAIRGTYVRALDLANDLISFDEAVATIQARDLRAMLGALFTELEKILRNAAYLQKIVLVAHFPFISRFVVQPVPFDAEATSRQWGVMDVPLRDEVWLRDTLSTTIDYAHSRLGEALPSPSSRSTASAARDITTASCVSQPDSSSSSSGRAITANPNADDTVIKFLEFFSVDALVAPLADPAKDTADAAVAAGSSQAPSPASVPTTSPLLSALHARSRFLTLQGICDAVDAACTSVRAKYPFVAEALLSKLALVLTAELRDAVRVKLVSEVRAMQQEWDLQVLWAQLNYHVEFMFHVLCNAREAQDDADDAVTLLPYLRQKNLNSRVQRTALLMHEAERQGDDGATLDRLLSTFESSGLLRVVEEAGTVSFSLVGAVKKSQADIRKANEGQQRQYAAMQSDAAKWMAQADGDAGRGGGAGGSGPPVMQLRASLLRRWFVFTAMNAVTCYECAARFYSRSCDRVPEFRLLSEEDSVVGFFKRFLRATYIPTLHAFHSQQLQALCMSIGDNGVGAGGATATTDPTAAESVTGTDNKAGRPPALPPGGTTSNAAGRAPTSLNSLSGAWPTVLVDGVPFPILACVQYVGQVLAKISDVRSVLPASLTNEVEQNTSEALLMELVVFLKRQVQWLGRGTLAHRLLDQAFEDAFAGLPNRKWAALSDEEHIDQAHRFIDDDLQRYYQLNSEERTSGHEYNDTAALSELQAMAALDATSVAGAGSTWASSQDGGGDLNPQIGRMEPRDICICDDSTLVAFALLCTSAEWLCDALLRHLWPGQRRGRNYTDCCVPGYTFCHEMHVGDTTSFSIVDGDYAAEHKFRLSGHLTRLCSIAQVSLFHLSVEARFLAFLFLPQLRDVSYDVVALSGTADNFVQAYARRVHNFYAILRQHLYAKKVKFTCLTAGRPASELVLCELAHLRYKAISPAGLMRLRTDLLVMQTTLQLVLPADSDVREMVPRDFVRPALFLRYVFNKDVVNEIVSSLDYQFFSTKEVEVLIRLVFRQVSGANDDTLATQHIECFYQKLQTIEKLRSRRGVTAAAAATTTTTSANASTVGSIAMKPGGAIGSASRAPAAAESNNSNGRGSGGGGTQLLVPPPTASVNAAAVVAAALNDDNYREDSSDGDGNADDAANAAPPLPLLSSSRSRPKTAATSAPPTTAPKLTPPPLTVAAAGAPGAPGAVTPVPSSDGENDEEEEEEEDEEEEEEEDEEEEEEETPERVVGAAARPASSAVAPVPLPARSAGETVATAARHVDPTARPSPPPRPVVPPLATVAAMAANASKSTAGGGGGAPASAAARGGVHVESSEEEEDEEIRIRGSD